jgi:hypothetical protein
MATPLQILKGFLNTKLAALTDEQRQTAIDAVKAEVAVDAYGELWAYQVADLAAHDILQELAADAAESSGLSSGAVQTAKRIKLGKREVEYATASSSSSSAAGRSDEDLGRSVYGQRYLRRRESTVVGFAVSE